VGTARVVAAALVAVALGPFAPASAAHVYRFHLIRSTSATALGLKCSGTSLLLTWRGRRYRPSGRVRCILSDGDKQIGWRLLTISSTYAVPPGKVDVRWSFIPIGYHAVSGTYSYCIPGRPEHPGGCETRRLTEKGTQWGNVW
jgi:hypothetical protein